MRKTWMLACAGWLLFTPGAQAFNSFLAEVPYIELPSPKILGDNQHDFAIEHHFNDWNIESMTFRFSYGLADVLEVDATALYHSTQIDFSNGTSQVTAHEFEAEALYVLMNESRNPCDLVLLAGANELFASATFQDHQTTDRTTRFSGGLMAGDTVFPWLALEAGLLGVYNQADARTAAGLGLGVKFMLNNTVALVGEAPVLWRNPYGWLNPWSAGVQFHLGPHLWTLFVTNTYAPTIPYRLQGLPLTYYCFRWAF